MTALAPLAALEARLGLDPGTLSGVDKVRAQSALDDASALVRGEARQEWLDTAGNPNAPDPVVRVVLGAALRNYRNPDAETSQTVGPFARTVRSGDTGVYLTEAERRIVQRYRKAESTGLWALRTTRESVEDSTVWINDQFGTEPFPIGTVDPWR